MNSWQELKNKFDVKMNEVNMMCGRAKNGGDSDKLDAIHFLHTTLVGLQEEVLRINAYEPRLRYWQQGNYVWASTRDESFNKERFVHEIDLLDYESLRRQEYAQLTPSSPR